MKILPALVTSSLLANAVLGVMLFMRTPSGSAVAEQPRPLENLRNPANVRPPAGAPDITANTWALFDSADTAHWVTQLRANGFPARVVRAVVHADVKQRLAGRYQSIAAAAAAVPYWRGSAFSLAAEPKLERARRALDREASERAAELLGGSEHEISAAEQRSLQRQFGDLWPEKLAEIQRIRADYADLMSDIRGEARGVMLPEDSEKLAYLEAEQRADLAQLLSNEELENFDLRSSRTAAQLRHQLSSFEPTEAEYRALFRIHQKTAAESGAASSNQLRALADVQKQFGPEIQAALGPERYAEYQKTTDPVWLNADRFTRDMGLPKAVTTQLVSVQQELMRRAAEIRSNPALPADQQQRQLAAIAQEARARLLPTLGERGLTAYQRNSGIWLRSLQTPETRRANP